MWALRRASVHLRNRCLSSDLAVRVCSVNSAVESCYFENNITEFAQSGERRSFHHTSRSSKSFSISQFVSSLAGDKRSGDGNGALEDSSSLPQTRGEDESIFESDRSVGESADNELEEGDGDGDEKKSPKTEAPSELTKVILSVPAKEVTRVLDEWVEAGNEVNPAEVSSTAMYLQKYRWFAKALQFYEWLESREKIEFTENDYAFRVDLIAKVQGSFKAEEYIQRIPESFRIETVYKNLLRHYVMTSNVYKSEKLFNKMKDLFPLTAASCDQMLILYKKTNRKKIASITSFMEKEHIKPSGVTCQILIDVEGSYGNISGMEQVFETMKSKGVKPSLRNRASMAQYYASGNLKVKAEAVLKDMEGGDLVKNRAACRFLLPVYASLGRDKTVGRIWREIEASNPTLEECIAAIKAWGKLKRIEDAEAAFETLSKILERPSSKYYAFMLSVYADHKMMTEGEDLFKRMRELGINIRIQAWDALVNLYIGVGELEKADAVLVEAFQARKGKPNFSTFMKILEGYAARGDVQNTEKIFTMMRKAGYVTRPKPYYSLLHAYINAKAPVDGIDKRLRRDGVIPDHKLNQLLAQVAAFRTPSWVSRSSCLVKWRV